MATRLPPKAIAKKLALIRVRPSSRCGNAAIPGAMRSKWGLIARSLL
jgi:hypothetical protein